VSCIYTCIHILRNRLCIQLIMMHVHGTLAIFRRKKQAHRVCHVYIYMYIYRNRVCIRLVMTHVHGTLAVFRCEVNACVVEAKWMLNVLFKQQVPHPLDCRSAHTSSHTHKVLMCTLTKYSCVHSQTSPHARAARSSGHYLEAIFEDCRYHSDVGTCIS